MKITQRYPNPNDDHSQPELSATEAPLLYSSSRPSLRKARVNVSTSFLLEITLLVSPVICTVAVRVLFGSTFLWYHIHIAILLSLQWLW